MDRMGYEEGFEALNTGDYRRAVELLGQAAESTGFTSDMVNHAYTLALHRANERERLADVAFRVGAHFMDSDPASAMDYFQRALQAGLDSGRARTIGEIYEEIGGKQTAPPLQSRILRVGHVVPTQAQGHPLSIYIRMLSERLKSHGIESTVFATEANSGWFINSATPAPEGDFVERSDRIAAAIRDSGIPLVFHHASLSDQIASRVAALRPSPLQINVDHEGEMDADLFQGCIHLSQNGLERSRFKDRPAIWIPSTSDIENRLKETVFESRSSLGVESATSASASFSGPNRNQADFVNALIELLKRFPKHFHFFTGTGDVRAFRGLLHSEGVLSRIRFLGQTADTLKLLGAIDVYLAPFPDAGRISVLELMGAAKPVVAMRHASNSEFNTTAELIGLPELTPRTPGEYIQIADKLLRDPASRSRAGDALHERFSTEFNPARLGERYLAFIEGLTQQPRRGERA
jgi:glycosyltransferase involved in cell wall biosynthesis